MRLSSFISGITILSRYYKDLDGHHPAAEHDQFFMYPTDRPLTPEDFKKMKDLGWFQTFDDHEEHEEGKYDPSAGWSAFV